ncbi:DUF4330 domain-containing protein [Lachnospiraceae bacterium NSJ-143]|nr:DUF4330 domain-containing protein [Lachnospiraceae bacterium NSJ-143]
MENKRRRINVFDIVIVIIILAVAFVGYKYLHREKIGETKTIRYTFELIDNYEGFSELINVGDDITDNVKNYYMGKVVEVKAEPYKKLVNDTVTGSVKESAVPGRERDIITVEAEVTEGGSDLKVNGYYTVKVGLEVAVKGNGYAGRGYILDIER